MSQKRQAPTTYNIYIYIYIYIYILIYLFHQEGRHKRKTNYLNKQSKLELASLHNASIYRTLHAKIKKYIDKYSHTLMNKSEVE